MGKGKEARIWQEGEDVCNILDIKRLMPSDDDCLVR